MSEQSKLICTIPAEHSGWRLDRSLAAIFTDYSRARIQTWITSDLVTVDGECQQSRYILRGGECVEMLAVQEDINLNCEPENISLDTVYEDEHIVVLNKPAGLVVHQGAGNWTGTLQNALLYHFPEVAALPRAGIVHRLDKDTSGLMVVAKSMAAYTNLVEQMQSRRVHRYYYAVVRGQLISGGVIDRPIGRHPHDRTKMTISTKGKNAVTHYKIKEKFQHHTWIDVRLETGRTHQIRVHFSSLNFPLVGDKTYAQRTQKVAGVSESLNDYLCSFPRQALHAYRLAFNHPVSNKELAWQVAMPSDMEQLLTMLREHSSL